MFGRVFFFRLFVGLLVSFWFWLFLVLFFFAGASLFFGSFSLPFFLLPLLVVLGGCVSLGCCFLLGFWFSLVFSFVISKVLRLFLFGASLGAFCSGCLWSVSLLSFFLFALLCFLVFLGFGVVFCLFYFLFCSSWVLLSGFWGLFCPLFCWFQFLCCFFCLCWVLVFFAVLVSVCGCFSVVFFGFVVLCSFVVFGFVFRPGDFVGLSFVAFFFRFCVVALVVFYFLVLGPFWLLISLRLFFWFSWVFLFCFL